MHTMVYKVCVMYNILRITLRNCQLYQENILRTNHIPQYQRGAVHKTININAHLVQLGHAQIKILAVQQRV